MKKAPVAASRVPRRAIFIDVENTSSEENLLNVIGHLQIDRSAQPTELLAVGNWRSVGARVARLLAGLGAQLVHSAPAIGVRDWSDLWIAVAAGRWLATAVPGDTLEVVSDDRAFDAVADAAAALGVTFKRISHRSIPASAPRPAAPEPAAAPRPRHRRGRRGHGRPAAHAPAAVHAPAASADEGGPGHPPAAARAAAEPGPVTSDEEAHAASHEQIRAALARHAGGGGHWINLDVLAQALKTEGFVRPPGSPRLVTRLRKMKDVEVSPSGMVRLLAGAAPETEAAAAVAPPHAHAHRPRRRGGRRRRARPADESRPTTSEEHSE
ncbi:MAG: hypothetical protein ACHQ4J_03320 [Candidatus Binatia bacterium]